MVAVISRRRGGCGYQIVGFMVRKVASRTVRRRPTFDVKQRAFIIFAKFAARMFKFPDWWL